MIKKLLVAGLLVASVASADARRRAVRFPPPPSHIMINVAADDAVRYTNHAAVPNTIRACLERTHQCVTDTLNPGASITKTRLVHTLGRNTANLELTTTGNAEIRGTNDTIPTHLMTMERQVIPHMSPGQTLDIYTWNHGTATLITRGYNGVQKNTQTVDLHPGTTTITLPGTPGSLGDQYDLLPTTPTIATSTINSTTHRAKTFHEATGRQYLTRANDQTTAFIKNIDPTSILTLTSIRYTPDANGTFANFFDAINWGVKYVNNMTNGITGSVDLHGMRVNDVEQPFLAWSNTPFQTEGATANTKGLIAQRYNLSLNQPGTTITLFAPHRAVTYTITGFNDAGTTTGSITGTLNTNASHDLDITSLQATRITASVNDVDTFTAPPQLLITTNNGNEKTGYRIEKPTPKITGEEYVTKWLDPHKQQYFYLANTEVRCMINGNCGTRSYAPDMAAVLGPATSNAPQDIEVLLRQWVNGNLNDGELYTGFDPLNTSMVNSVVGFYFMPDGQGVSRFTMTASAMPSWFGVVRSFLTEYTQTNPQLYGGTSTTGPNLDYHPTWSTQDPN